MHAGGTDGPCFAFLDILQCIQGSEKRPDVILGVDTEAPPLPEAATMRLNMLDIVANFQALVASGVAGKQA